MSSLLCVQSQWPFARWCNCPHCPPFDPNQEQLSGSCTRKPFQNMRMRGSRIKMVRTPTLLPTGVFIETSVLLVQCGGIRLKWSFSCSSLPAVLGSTCGTGNPGGKWTFLLRSKIGPRFAASAGERSRKEFLKEKASLTLTLRLTGKQAEAALTSLCLSRLKFSQQSIFQVQLIYQWSHLNVWLSVWFNWKEMALDWRTKL